ncbi:MAG: sulfur carrier protein ThiS [Deltaproteobacteria bacterium]|nr:sulfur carrier protein ThiS [Deltaproteobacteria bacterium]
MALNEEVVPRSMHSKTSVQNGDRVEILRAVAGG